MSNILNNLTFRSNRSTPLSYQELDDNFRKPNQWDISYQTGYKLGMVVLWDDSEYNEHGALTFWQCLVGHIPSDSNKPGIDGTWTRIGAAATSTGPALLISLTYAQLLTLKNLSSLVIGQEYIINDFQSTTTSPIEPLLVTAISTNTFYHIAKSASFPKDEIYYDISGGTKGGIYRRIDTIQNNDIGFDYRNIKFLRYKIDVTTTHATGNASFNKFAVIKKTGTSEIYIKLNYTNAPFTDTSAWKLFPFSNLSYVAPTNLYGYYDNGIEEWVNIYGFWQVQTDNLDFLIPVTNDVMEFHMFSTTPYTTGVQSSYSTIYNNIFEHTGSLPNTVFFGTDINNNKISYNFYGNTIKTGFINNTIGSDFANNIVEHSFSDNKISKYAMDNIFGNYFQRNSIGISCQKNIIGNSNSNNIIGMSFELNTIGNTFTSNTIENNFAVNSIGNNFSNNIIGSWIGNIDFLSATYVYQPYLKELYVNQNFTPRLKYYDRFDSLQIVNANS